SCAIKLLLNRHASRCCASSSGFGAWSSSPHSGGEPLGSTEDRRSQRRRRISVSSAFTAIRYTHVVRRLSPRKVPSLARTVSNVSWVASSTRAGNACSSTSTGRLERRYESRPRTTWSRSAAQALSRSALSASSHSALVRFSDIFGHLVHEPAALRAPHPGQHGAHLDLLALGHQDLLHGARVLRGHLDLHLHCLERHHRVARRDRAPGPDRHRGHQTRNRSHDLHDVSHARSSARI